MKKGAKLAKRQTNTDAKPHLSLSTLYTMLDREKQDCYYSHAPEGFMSSPCDHTDSRMHTQQ